MTPDWLLLRRYAREDSQEAFAALTARYLNLVYSVCLREVHDPELAQEVTQAVFLLLARTAPAFRSKTALPGWLFRTARFAAQNTRTREQRRRHHEGKAALAMQQESEGAENAAWSEIEPVLNDALAALRERDRECVLLRFFQGLSFSEAGAALGLSEEAARKRVGRALEKMRAFFGKEGVIVPVAVLAVLLPAHSVRAAPTGFVVGQGGTNLVAPQVSRLMEGVSHAMKIAKMKTFAVGASAALVATAATYGVVRGAPPAAKTTHAASPVPAPAPPIPPDLIKKVLADSAPSQYRTVALTGRVRLPDGVPVGGVHISAQVQNTDMARLNGLPLAAQTEEEGALAHTRPDGTYTLYVGAGVPYNVTVVPANLLVNDDHDTKHVAAALVGVSGQKGATVHVPDMILVKGGFVTGIVTNKRTGGPVAGATVMSYGPHRPESSAAVILTKTDSHGRYRLRVAPGRSRVYEADRDKYAYDVQNDRRLEVAEGQTKTLNFAVTPTR